MRLLTLRLNHFRNYREQGWSFETPLTVFVGPNAVGKTNILEAVYLLASGLSFRARIVDEMVGWGDEVAHVGGEIEVLSGLARNSRRARQNDTLALKSLASESSGGQRDEVELRVTLTKGIVQGARVAKRKFLVNGISRLRRDFVGNLLAVLFRPEDLDLIRGNPSLRRGFLDGVLSQVDREYRRSLISYEKALRRRNRLLDLIREGEVARTALVFWDQVLIKDGAVLTRGRRELIEFIGGQPALSGELIIRYDFSAISESRLEQYADKEVAAGYTLVGPHKDDFVVEMRSNDHQLQRGVSLDRNLAAYGSRGEQRMVVLWLKLAELDYIEYVTGERPLLLLDDIFSELDQEHRKVVASLLDRQQTFLTMADEHFLLEMTQKPRMIKLGRKNEE